MTAEHEILMEQLSKLANAEEQDCNTYKKLAASLEGDMHHQYVDMIETIAEEERIHKENIEFIMAQLMKSHGEADPK